MKYRPINPAISRNRFMVLTLALVALFVIHPFVKVEAFLGNVLLDLVFLAISLATIWAISYRRRVFYAAIVLAILGFLGRWIKVNGMEDAVSFAGAICDILFFVVTVSAILGYVLRSEPVSVDKLFAAVCAYLFFGLIWAMVCDMMERLQPGSFASLTKGTDQFLEMTYYSFVTMTTLGYGDVTPISAPAKSFACLQAAMGQLYPAILIARLVGLHTAHTLSRPAGNGRG